MHSVEFEGKKWIPAGNGSQCDDLVAQLIQQAVREANAAWDECMVQWRLVREECARNGIRRTEGDALKDAIERAGLGGTEVEERLMGHQALALHHRRQAGNWSFSARWLLDQFWTRVEVPESDRLLLGKFQMEEADAK